MALEKIVYKILEILETKKEMGLLEQQIREAAEAFERLRIRLERIEKELRGERREA